MYRVKPKIVISFLHITRNRSDAVEYNSVDEISVGQRQLELLIRDSAFSPTSPTEKSFYSIVLSVEQQHL
jgi:hypothetical protein